MLCRHKPLLLSTWPTVLFLMQFDNLTGIQASIGVTRCYSSACSYVLLPEGAWFSRLSPEAVKLSVCTCVCVRACVYYWSKTESLLSNGGICISHSTTFLVVRSECQLNLLEWKQNVNWYMPAALSGFWWVCAWMFVCIIVRLFVCVCVLLCEQSLKHTSCWKMRCLCVHPVRAATSSTPMPWLVPSGFCLCSANHLSTSPNHTLRCHGMIGGCLATNGRTRKLPSNQW